MYIAYVMIHESTSNYLNLVEQISVNKHLW